MLTVQQADILALLADFKCLRHTHIKKYLAAKHKSTPEHTLIMLKQLNAMGKIKFGDGYVMLPGRKMDADVLKAFDVMMDLTDGAADFIYPGINPFSLMFSVEAEHTDTPAELYGEQYIYKRNNNFGVINVGPFHESRIYSRLHGIDRDLTVIFILADKEQRKLIRSENKHYYALQGENGRYKFFKAVNEPRKS